MCDLFDEYCAGSRSAEESERTKTAGFFSVDSGSEPEDSSSVNVSTLVNIVFVL